MKKQLFPFIFALLLVGSIANADTTILCRDNQTAELNISITTNVDGTIVVTNTTERIRCPFGCDNITSGIGDCKPNQTESTSFDIALVLGLTMMAFFFFYIATKLDKSLAPLHVLFMMSALLAMIVDAYLLLTFAQRGFLKAEPVFTQFYLLATVIIIFVFAYMLFNIIKVAADNARKRKLGIED